MRIYDGDEFCQDCGKEKAVIHCDGCQKLLCIKCRCFDLWGYGCGHVDPKVFCFPCADDPRVNPYGGKIA